MPGLNIHLIILLPAWSPATVWARPLPAEEEDAPPPLCTVPPFAHRPSSTVDGFQPVRRFGFSTAPSILL